jgi:cation:H+ antiporter
VFIAWYQLRKTTAEPRPRWEGIRLTRDHSIELGFLWVATLYSLTLPLKSSITLIDTVVLVGLFAGYTWRVSRAPAEEPHLVGPARYLGTFGTIARRAWVIGLFLGSGTVIWLFAHTFAEALVQAGKQLHINEFLLVQWLAPLASETPELLVAGLFAWRLNSNAGLGTLVSSKVNQWTLLVGTLPIVFAISSASWHGLPISAIQREELFLTAAQSVFAIAVLVSRSISVKEAFALLGLFLGQFVLGGLLPDDVRELERIIVGIVYLVLAAWIMFRERGYLRPLARDGVVVPVEELFHDDDADRATASSQPHEA